jgi:hypothetical protein
MEDRYESYCGVLSYIIIQREEYTDSVLKIEGYGSILNVVKMLA